MVVTGRERLRSEFAENDRTINEMGSSRIRMLFSSRRVGTTGFIPVWLIARLRRLTRFIAMTKQMKKYLAVIFVALTIVSGLTVHQSATAQTPTQRTPPGYRQGILRMVHQTRCRRSRLSADG
jgi:hypothetical protein